MKKLILAEKPSVARDFAKYIGGLDQKDGYFEGKEFIVTWVFGHMLTIDDSEWKEKWSIEGLPIFPEKFKYKVYSDKKKQVSILKDLCKKSSEFIIATDAGREGELIARLVMEHCNFKGKVSRVWTSEALSKEVVNRELKNRKEGSKFNGLYNSALARQHADWLMGINLTRLVTLKSDRKQLWSVGRVQTPILKMIVDRHFEIEGFTAKPFWQLILDHDKSGTSFKSTYYSSDDAKRIDRFESLEEAKTIKELAESSKWKVLSVSKKEKFKSPPLLHSLTSLQQEASKLYSLTPDQTLKVAQILYEKKIISYPRTGANYLDESAETKDLVKNILEKLGEANLSHRIKTVGKKVFNQKKLTDHYALIPLSQAGSLDKNEERIYSLIKRRFIGAFMEDYRYEATTVEMLGENDNKPLKSSAKGNRVISPGWKSLHLKSESKEKEEQIFPTLEKGEYLKTKVDPLKEGKTSPPPKYSFSSMLGKLEELCLGTPATHAQIFKVLEKRNFISVKKAQLVPTASGIALIKFVGERKFSSPDFTSEWEKSLNELYIKNLDSGSYNKFISQLKTYIKSQIEEIKSLEATSLTSDKIVDFYCSCSKDKKTIYAGPKRHICNSCKRVVYNEVAKKKLSKTAIKSLFAGKEVTVDGMTSKAGKKFNAILHWDEEGKLKFKFAENKSKESSIKCICNANLTESAKLFFCKSCDLKVWKGFMGKILKEEKIKELLSGKEVLLCGLKSKAGKVFDAYLKFDEKRVKISRFPERKNK